MHLINSAMDAGNLLKMIGIGLTKRARGYAGSDVV
jgi:hypothetical protein